MLKNLFQKQNSEIAGFDISSSQVKLMILCKENKGYRVKTYGSAPLPEGAVVEKEIKDMEKVTQAIKAAIQNARTSVKYAAIALADSSVITRVIPVDKTLSESEMEAQILLDAEKHIPYPLEEVRFDFVVIGDTVQDSRHVDVLLAASRAETVDSYTHAFSQADITTKIVDIESDAVVRAYQCLTQFQPELKKNTVAIIDVGIQRTLLTVIHEDISVFTHNATFGGERLTKELAANYHINEVEAEKMKLSGSWPPEAEEKVIKVFKDNVVQQIRRELQYFASASHFNEIDQIILVGGSANLPNLAEYVSELTEVPTVVGNLFTHMTFDDKKQQQELTKFAPEFFIACGLALRSLDK